MEYNQLLSNNVIHVVFRDQVSKIFLILSRALSSIVKSFSSGLIQIQGWTRPSFSPTNPEGAAGELGRDSVTGCGNRTRGMALS